MDNNACRLEFAQQPRNVQIQQNGRALDPPTEHQTMESRRSRTMYNLRLEQFVNMVACPSLSCGRWPECRLGQGGRGGTPTCCVPGLPGTALKRFFPQFHACGLDSSQSQSPLPPSGLVLCEFCAFPLREWSRAKFWFCCTRGHHRVRLSYGPTVSHGSPM